MSTDSSQGIGKCVRRLEDGRDVVSGHVALTVRPEEVVQRLVLDHVGVDRAWVDGVDPDHVGASSVRQRPHQPDDAVLGRRVRRGVGGALETRGGARDDDRAAARRPQVGDGRLDGVPHPAEVDVNGVAPRLLAQVLGRAKGDDAGVGGHDVEPAEAGDAVVERRLQRVVVADVRLGGDDAPAECLDPV